MLLGLLRLHPVHREHDVNYGSTFSGIGGLDRAFEYVLGARCAYACDTSAYCREILAQHAARDLPLLRDVRAVTAATVPRTDAIIGGFPCQDVSDAGQRRGLEHGERTGLWSELARCLDELQPSIGFFENVRGLLSRGFEHVLADLAALGFDASWCCVRASDVGAPHRRERVFILATTADGRERLADAYCERLRQRAERNLLGQAFGRDTLPLDAGADDMGDTAGIRCERPERGTESLLTAATRAGPRVADTARERHAREDAGRGAPARRGQSEPPHGGVDVADRVHDGRGELGPSDDDDRHHAPGDLADRRDAERLDRHRWPPGPADTQGWARWPGARPSFRRGPDGLPGWVDRSRLAEGLRRARLRALGNAVVSQQAAFALDRLVREAIGWPSYTGGLYVEPEPGAGGALCRQR